MKTFLSIFGLFLAFSVTAQKTQGEFHLDKEYNISPTGTVDLNSSDAKVYITGSSRKTAHVKIDHEVTTKGITFGGHYEFTVDVTEQGGDLDIKEHSNSVSIGMVGYHYEKYSITIEVPQGTSLKVKGDDGDYWIKNIDGAISLQLDDADVEMSQCSGDKFRFRIDDGDINMDEAKGSLELDGDDSDVKIRNANFTFIDARVDDGDLVIETSLADNGEYFIDAQDGLISMAITKGGGKFDIRHDDGRVITEGNFTTDEDSENRTTLTLASGSAKVNIHADDARVKLIKQ
jgi:Putative adhesin